MKVWVPGQERYANPDKPGYFLSQDPAYSYINAGLARERYFPH